MRAPTVQRHRIDDTVYSVDTFALDKSRESRGVATEPVATDPCTSLLKKRKKHSSFALFTYYRLRYPQNFHGKSAKFLENQSQCTKLISSFERRGYIKARFIRRVASYTNDVAHAQNVNLEKTSYLHFSHSYIKQ